MSLICDRFKSGAVPILLATDVASRGLDIPSVDLVINFDLPMLARDYVHRVGRTARAKREGWSLSFVSQVQLLLLNTVLEEYFIQRIFHVRTFNMIRLDLMRK